MSVQIYTFSGEFFVFLYIFSGEFWREPYTFSGEFLDTYTIFMNIRFILRILLTIIGNTIPFS